MKKILLLTVLLSTLLWGCTRPPESGVKTYFDKLLREEWVHDLGGVTGYELRNYEIVRSTKELTVVKLTFAAKSGSDLQQTKRFKINQEGFVVPLEREDVLAGVQHNLRYVFEQAFGIDHKALGLGADSVVFGDLLVKANETAYGNLISVAGEDYKKAVLNYDEIWVRSVSLSLPDGAVVVYPETP